MPQYLSPSRTLSIHRLDTKPEGLPDDGLTNFSSGRQAVFALARHLCPNEQTGQVLLPVWVPEGIYLPFVRAGWKIVFYDLDKTANPSWDHVESLIIQHSFNLLVLVHYFGQARDHLRMEKLAQGHCPILEDWAHSYPSSNWPRPSNGNWALFSPTKLVGTTDGAWLIGPNKISRYSKDATRSKRYAYVLWQLLYLVSSTFLWQKIPGSVFWQRLSGGSYARGYRLLLTLTDQPAAISSLGAWLLSHTQHKQVVTKRLEQAKQYSNGLRNPHFQLLGDLGKSATPWVGFPLIVDDAEAFASYLALHNIRGQRFTDRWWFYQDTSQYPAARRIWTQHYLLPIHQRFSPEDIDRIIQVANAYNRDKR